jgi:pimeloyl-ACP methyl ester carboxylesterase
MARTTLSGIEIEYELLGDTGAPAFVITPGGRFSKDVPGIHELGNALAEAGKRALLWDRPNCGASDLCFDGDSEGQIQARALCELVEHLELGPTALAGGSGGARTSLMAALRQPELFSHLCMWWVSGGIASLMMMGAAYCSEIALAANNEGMEAVTNLSAFADQLKRNPRNRDILMRQDAKKFVATMEKWAESYQPPERYALPGASREQLAEIRFPVMIFKNSPLDFFHRAPVTEWAHSAIPHSVLIDLPWQEDVFAKRMKEAVSSGSGVGHFTDWPDLAPDLLKFVEQ